MARIPVLSGLDVLRYRQSFAPLRGQKVGLVTHPAAVTSGTLGPICSAHQLFVQEGSFELAALFGPEHGFSGEAQDLEGVSGGTSDSASGVPIYSLYGDSFESLKPTVDQLRGLDRLVIDLQDVGSRYYTFQTTMLYCLEAAAQVGLPVIVLDRPNPLGGDIEGPSLQSGFESFVGSHPIPIRHGLTVGELARLYQHERAIPVDLTVIPCEGWTRSTGWPANWPWVLPSPNMPTRETACVYPGMCLIEGTNLSEGRGTTRPFELMGFPGVDARRLVDRLQEQGFEGITFLPMSFRPTFQKQAGKTCTGVFLVVTDPQQFQPVRTGLALLIAFREQLGERFQWRRETYEFVSHIPAIDLLFGSDRERRAIESGQAWREIADHWIPAETQFRERRQPFLMYPD